MAVTFTSIAKHHLIVKGAQIAYEPSFHNGTGTEVRKNLVLVVDQQTRDQLTAIETQLHLGATLFSVVKPETIRVNVDTDQVRLFDADHHPINPLEKWVHNNVEVCLEVRGTWRTATNTGISVCCTDTRFAEDTSISPFR